MDGTRPFEFVEDIKKLKHGRIITTRLHVVACYGTVTFLHVERDGRQTPHITGPREGGFVVGNKSSEHSLLAEKNLVVLL